MFKEMFVDYKLMKGGVGGPGGDMSDVLAVSSITGQSRHSS